MEAWVRLALLLAGVAVSICASPQEHPDTNPDSSTALADAIATHNRAPDVPSVIRLFEPGSEDRQAQKCTIVNNKRRCRPFRPGIGSVIGRGEQKEKVAEQAVQDTRLLQHAPTYI